jgi:hypothetical protein
MQTINLNILATDYKKYSIDTSAKLYLTFDEKKPINQINDQVLEYASLSNINFVQSPHGSALQLQPSQKFSTTIDSPFTDQFTFGFWLKSTHIQPSVNTLTGLPIYFRTALFDKANFQYSNVSQYVSATDATFVIYEESREDNFNVLKILLISSSLDEIYVETEKYATDKYHHFWIAYYGPTRTLDVYIDGEIASLYSESGAQIPSSVNNNVATKFNINNSAVGYTSVLRNNSGCIDEVVFYDRYVSDNKLISKVINYGANYIIDFSKSYEEIVHECFLFDDPTCLGIKCMAITGKTIYVGRNDGVLFKGDRSMWQSRKDFGNQKEIDSLQKYITNVETSKITTVAGNLEIASASVRV